MSQPQPIVNDGSQTSNHRNWCLTVNNPTDADLLICQTLEANVRLTCVVVGQEVGEFGTPHYQIALSYRDPVRFTAVAGLFGGRAHVEVCRNLTAAIIYCRKDGNMIIDKDGRTGQGARSDLGVLVDCLTTGGLQKAKVIVPEMLIKFPAGCKLFVSIGIAPSRPTMRVFTLVGPPGCGKTSWAHAEFPGAYFWSPSGQGNHVWWDGYNGESTIIIDDFEPAALPYEVFVRLLDRYPLMLGVKGGTVPCEATTIVLTSNTLPHMWYTKQPLDAVERRTIRDIGTLLVPAADGSGFPPLVPKPAVAVDVIEVHDVIDCDDEQVPNDIV